MLMYLLTRFCCAAICRSKVKGLRTHVVSSSTPYLYSEKWMPTLQFCRQPGHDDGDYIGLPTSRDVAITIRLKYAYKYNRNMTR